MSLVGICLRPGWQLTWYRQPDYPAAIPEYFQFITNNAIRSNHCHFIRIRISLFVLLTRIGIENLETVTKFRSVIVWKLHTVFDMWRKYPAWTMGWWMFSFLAVFRNTWNSLLNNCWLNLYITKNGFTRKNSCNKKSMKTGILQENIWVADFIISATSYIVVRLAFQWYSSIQAVEM